MSNSDTRQRKMYKEPIYFEVIVHSKGWLIWQFNDLLIV